MKMMDLTTTTTSKVYEKWGRSSKKRGNRGPLGVGYSTALKDGIKPGLNCFTENLTLLAAITLKSP